MKQVVWHFDFVSPFAYLQSCHLDDFLEVAVVRCKPVLFAGLLKHWGHKGPAEIPPKRKVTFDTIAWLAQRYGLPIRYPAHHPFNPLPLLRLAVADGLATHAENADKPDSPSVGTVQRIFRFVWQEGHLPTDAEAFASLCHEFGFEPEDLDGEAVKARLRANTEQAIADGVFGVPTSLCSDDAVPGERELFWGFDARPMVLAWAEDDPFFGSAELAAARALPDGIQRRA